MKKSSTKESGAKALTLEKEKDCRYGKMGQFMRAGGLITKPMEEAD